MLCHLNLHFTTIMPADRLSLYIDLEEGQKADLEVVSRSALAFAEAVREISAFIDPFSDTRLELVGTTEGSLSLNTKIKFKTASGVYEFSVYALLLIFATYMATQAGSFLAEKAISSAWEQMFGPQEATISQADKDEIVKRAVAALEAKAGEREIKRIFAELDNDPAISGVGITPRPSERPPNIVPKSEFKRRSGQVVVEQPAEKKRVQRDIYDAILVSPVLQNDRKRRWKFRIGETEFGAPIRDDVFLDAVFSGKHPILMKGSIHMRIALETQEEFINGVWVPKDRIVWNVIDVPGQYQGPQNLLPFDDLPKTQ